MLTLPATLTQVHARNCLQELTDGLKVESEQVVVDATPLRSFDSAALAVLLEVRRECARLGKHFAVQGMPQRLRDLASLYGIEGLLTAA